MKIIIQRDGLICVEEHGEEPRFADKTDPLAILNLYRAHVVFEDGLTSRQLMRALEPWKDALSRTGWFDFDAWFSAMDKTLLMPVTEDSQTPLKHIEISPTIDVRRDSDASRCEITINWDTFGRYSAPVTDSGMTFERCGVSLCDPRLIGNLPIKIIAATKIIDKSIGVPVGNEPLLHDTLPGEYDHIETVPTFFETVVLGFLDQISVHGTPEDTAEITDYLADSIDSITLANDHFSPKESDEPDVVSGPEVDQGSLAFENIYESLGLPDAEFLFRRSEAAFMISRMFDIIPRPTPDELQDLLGLSKSGVEKLRNGYTSIFSLDTLERFVTILVAHIGDPNA